MEDRKFTMRLTAKQKKIIKNIKIGDNSEVVTNPYSKVQCELNPEALAIYDLILGGYLSMSSLTFPLLPNKEKNAIEDIYFTARDIFIENWPEEYMKLVD